MGRPKHDQPTPAELEVLKVLWDRVEPASVRDVLDALNADAPEPRAYTTVMSLLNVMTDKGLLTRSPRGRAFVYEPATPRSQTLGDLLDETLRRVFDGSASQLVAHLLDRSSPSPEELVAIRSLIEAHQAAAAEAQESLASRQKGGRR
jgi:predicted transcriptional regulator